MLENIPDGRKYLDSNMYKTLFALRIVLLLMAKPKESTIISWKLIASNLIVLVESDIKMKL